MIILEEISTIDGKGMYKFQLKNILNGSIVLQCPSSYEHASSFATILKSIYNYYSDDSSVRLDIYSSSKKEKLLYKFVRNDKILMCSAHAVELSIVEKNIQLVKEYLDNKFANQ